MLFVDLRGFTPLSVTLDPGEIRRLLDRFYEYVSALVLAEDGTVMQFVGDEVYAVFGAPLTREDHAAAALRVACRIQDDRARLDEQLAADGLPPIRFGIGVHSGPAVAAHVGTATRSQYSVIGDTVNVGSRLCSLADAGQVVASGPTMTVAEDSAFVAVGAHHLKGIAEPMPLFRYGEGALRGTPTAGVT